MHNATPTKSWPASVFATWALNTRKRRSTSVTSSGGPAAPMISMACQTIGGSDLGRVNWTSTPHTPPRPSWKPSFRSPRSRTATTRSSSGLCPTPGRIAGWLSPGAVGVGDQRADRQHRPN